MTDQTRPYQMWHLQNQMVLLMLEAMDKAGVKPIITDDGDFVTVPGIRVFTANWRAIAAASSQGKLLVR